MGVLGGDVGLASGGDVVRVAVASFVEDGFGTATLPAGSGSVVLPAFKVRAIIVGITSVGKGVDISGRCKLAQPLSVNWASKRLAQSQ